ncbi:TonB-dependent receptor family protein [Gilvimarinus algae]|uniref:TonB-dependent receptor n=1 Tax=Gilvimarinus algae TaxID=3058037 RepID=A0ABT8TJ01_9GAMM|nr:TonB-dependent receptor [Gilvimarinus sp. SDUM040014]MDO3384076.1 TonB-dependent receptor [Gilvimarinus sp. SDUM040014]
MNVVKRCTVLVAWVLMASVLPAKGQSLGAIDETVIVTANREPQPWRLSSGAVDVVSETAQLPGFRFDSAELLAGLPGVQADSRSNFAQDTRISLRGFGARSAFGVRGINMRVDEIPLTMPDGQSQTSSIALDTVASAEVLRGPLAVLYGNGAGGVIAFRTEAPKSSRLGLLASAGDARQRRYRVRGEWAGERAAARVQASQFTTDGFRDHSSAERNQFTGQWFYRSDTGMALVARADISRDPHTEDPQGLTYEQWLADDTQVHPVAERFDPRKSIDHRQVSVSASQPTAWGSWQLAGWAGERSIEQFLSFPGDGENDNGAVIDLARDFSGINGRLSRHFGSLEWSAGFELAQMQDRRLGLVNDLGERGALKRDELGEVSNRDVYTGLAWQPLPAWRFQAGARFNSVLFDVRDDYITDTNPDDSGRREYSEPSYALGASYGKGDWRLYASAGEGFETPTLTELAYRNEGTGLNLELDSSRNRQAELGWRSETEALVASVTGFVVASRDELVVDQSEGGRTTYRNGAETRREGLEVLLDWSLHEQWNWRLGATLLKARYTAGPYRGNRLPGVAQETLYSKLDWSVAGERLMLTLATQYRGDIASGDDNLEVVPGALTWDLAAQSRYRWGATGLSLWAKLVNVTDKKYVGSVIVNQSRGRTIEPAPGRQINVGIELIRQW